MKRVLDELRYWRWKAGYRLNDLSGDFRYWLSYRWRRLVGRDGNIRDEAAVQELVDVLKVGFLWDIHKPCQLHPQNLATPFAAKCCFSPVLQMEDLSPVMQNVTYSEKHIKLSKS